MPKKPLNIVRYLEKKYGGEWEYSFKACMWVSADGRVVWATCNLDEGDAPYTPSYYLYSPDNPPVYIDWA
jgi:hypothetical protein